MIRISAARARSCIAGRRAAGIVSDGGGRGDCGGRELVSRLQIWRCEIGEREGGKGVKRSLGLPREGKGYLRVHNITQNPFHEKYPKF